MGDNHAAGPCSNQELRAGGPLLWLSGAWTLPLVAIMLWLLPASLLIRAGAIAAAVLLAPLIAVLYLRRKGSELQFKVRNAEERAAQLQL